MIHPIFPNYFFDLFSLPNKKEVIEKIKSARVDEKSSRAIEWNRYCKVKVEQLYLNEVGYLLSPSIRLFLENINEKSHLILKSIWKNTYTKGGHQEIHDHLFADGSDVSGCIFLEDQEDDSSGFFFFNRHSADLSEKWKENMLDNNMSPSHYFINPKAGDIIFFPSHMLHGVTIHRRDEPRTTISFNLKFV
tara:strand:+ start:118 stop:690 length:573 start_codon:yes stop_codon:yes gene_type:complete